MVIIYSGGMDSTVLLHRYKKEIKLAISFDYGSKHNDTEYLYAKLNTDKLGINHIRIPLNFINDYFESSLLKKGSDIPDGHYQEDVMKKTVVPFRNGIMLSIAAGLAESIGAQKILIGNHAGDHMIYPDCRMDFINSMNAAIRFGTWNNVEILSPFGEMTKRDIALLGKDLGIDFNETYSCYKGEQYHCGTCGTCVERKEALEGFDPTNYKII